MGNPRLVTKFFTDENGNKDTNGNLKMEKVIMDLLPHFTYRRSGTKWEGFYKKLEVPMLRLFYIGS